MGFGTEETRQGTPPLEGTVALCGSTERPVVIPQDCFLHELRAGEAAAGPLGLSCARGFWNEAWRQGRAWRAGGASRTQTLGALN